MRTWLNTAESQKHNCTSAFHIWHKTIFSVCSYLTHILSCWSAAHTQGPQPLRIEVSNKSGHVVCFGGNWPLPVIKVAYRYHFVLESFIQLDDAYLNQSPSCFAAMKLSPTKAQTEKVKPHLLTSARFRCRWEFSRSVNSKQVMVTFCKFHYELEFDISFGGFAPQSDVMRGMFENCLSVLIYIHC